MSSSKTTNYLVMVKAPDVSPEQRVEAAYYQHDVGFTVFKGEDGEQLASFANEHIVGIRRLPKEGIGPNI